MVFPPESIGLRRPRGLGFLAIVSLAMLAAGSAPAQTNLLGNGAFEAHDDLFRLEAWELGGGPGERIADPGIDETSPAGSVVLVLDQPPPDDGGDGTLPTFSARQVVDLTGVPLPGGEFRLVLAGLVARDARDPGDPAGVAARLDFAPDDPAAGAQPSSPLLVPRPPAPGGGFEPFFAALEFPPSAPPVVAFEFLKSEAGVVRLDGLQLFVEPLPFRLQPPVAPTPGGVPLRLEGPGIDALSPVFVNEQLADPIGGGPGFVEVLAPPAPGPGPAVVEVIDAEGAAATRPGALVYLEPLAVDAVEPAAASALGGTRIRLLGSGFRSGVGVTVGGVAVIGPPFLLGPDGVEVVVPPLPAGPQSVELVDPLLGEVLTASQPIQVVEPPIVENVAPAEGPLEGGTLITVTGSGFREGTQVLVDGFPGVDTEVVSPTVVQTVTPPRPLGEVLVTAISPEGVPSPSSAPFTFLGPMPGDVNRDFATRLDDVILALLGAAAADLEPTVIDPGHGDVDGDGALGLAEAVAAFRGNEPFFGQTFETLPAPALLVSDTATGPGTPIAAAITDLGFAGPGIIEWGDGFSTTVIDDALVTHAYLDPGEYPVRLRTDLGPTEPQLVTVVAPAPSLVVEQVELALDGVDLLGNPIAGRTAQIDPALPPVVRVMVTARGAGTVAGEFLLETPAASPGDPPAIASRPVTVPFDGAPGEVQTEIIELSLQGSDFPLNGDYFGGVRFFEAPGILVDPVGGRGFPVGLQVPSSVLEDECEEIERVWRERQLAKEAQKRDCEELERQIEECERRLAELEAEKAALQEARDNLESDIDTKQQEIDDLVEQIDDFYSGVGDVVIYTDGSEIPEDACFVGARRGGASAGAGISFIGAESMIARNDLYRKVHGHSVGRDLNTIRDCLKQKDEMEARLEDLDAQLDAACTAIDNLEAQLAAKRDLLDDCLMDCAAIEQEIEDLEDLHRDCLEELERQREAEGEAEDAINDAERDGTGIGEDADEVRGGADDADDFIDGRAGTPGQTAGDKGKTSAARACADTAEDLEAQGRARIEEAREALRSGDTDLAKQLAAEAKALFEQAKQKLAEARGAINDARSSARRRKPRECDDGDYMTGPTREYVVWDEIVDIALAPQGSTPEKWARTKENGQGILDGLKNLLDLIDIFGDRSPIAGTVTPDPGETAQKIVDAYLELIEQGFAFDVWIEARGHCEWKRTDKLCVDGCWEPREFSGTRDGVVERRIKYGIILGGNRDSRAEQLEKILVRFLNQSAQPK